MEKGKIGKKKKLGKKKEKEESKEDEKRGMRLEYRKKNRGGINGEKIGGKNRKGRKRKRTT